MKFFRSLKKRPTGPKLFPSGIKLLHDSQGAEIDIIFIHGLTGDREETWRAKDAPAPWPQTLLPHKIPNARILTFGYDAYWIGLRVVSGNKIGDHSMNLINAIAHFREKDSTNTRPIVFVCHSLGGLVCKDALQEAQHRPEMRFQQIAQSTRAIAFLGTPHHGSSLAYFSKALAQFFGSIKQTNPEILGVLKRDSEVLARVQRSFHTMIRSRAQLQLPPIEITCFFEELPLDVIGITVVPKDSAILPEYNSIGIHQNHIGMTKFQTEDDPGFEALTNELAQWYKECTRYFSDETHTNHSVIQGSVSEAHPSSAVNRIAMQPFYATCYYIPFLRNRRFVGRFEVLEEMKSKLFLDSACKTMAIAGLGGVGKTQLVLEFAFLIKEARPDYSIFWVPAFSREAFEQAYAEIAIRLGIIHTGENEEVKSLVKKHLEEETGRKWIMIVDNADDEDILFGAQLEDGIVEYLPESEDGFILFTSRHQKAAVALANSDVIELSQMSAWEATDFLAKSLTRKDLLCDDSETTELLNELTHLPLAIAQAAAYLNENKISVSKYLYLLRNTEQDMASLLSREFRDRTRYKDSKNAIATTWLVSFNQIRKKDPTAAEMLALIAFIEPKAIPRSIFPPIKPEERLEYAIGTLCAYDFITRRENEDIYDMHRLVHLAAQIWTRRHDLANATETKLIKHLNGVFPPNEYENRDLWREYFPHALALLQANKESHLKEVYSLCVKVGLCLVVDGRYREAISWLEISFSWCSHNLPEEDSDRQLSQHVLALALLDNGEVTKSIDLLQVLVRAQNSLAERDPKRLISQHVLSRAYLDNDQVDEAIELLQYIATIQEEVFEDHHPDRLASEHVLARAYLRNGRTEEAIKILQHVVSTAEKTLEKQHPDRLISQHVLGRAFLENGEVKKAIQLLQHVVTMRENHFDEQHPHRLEGQHFLARAFLADGQKTEAIKVLQHVVTVREGLLGHHHPKFLESYNLLSLAKEGEENTSQAI